ncbi:SDR family oxidoreductase [Desulfopila sp. IMCC35006]|uniref:SDR family NAD(P)-dependent oxidoreductase n=1 Tax=Desulfopila sp. IMCC35006 TaxID=2569542 RepID=UPI0010AB8EAB|nr:SDR family oxidoreductase [Desulfopila sp. IMCC35006]TKB23903.1 SDR family oxidoreductase [Desulfopila sp. IMCC35006]
MAKRIVIYGGSGGIGSATARLLRADGHALHLVGRSEAKLAPLAAELEAGYTVGDVCEEALFPKVTEDFAAPWDGLVYSVGTITLGSIRRLTSADFLHDFQVNAMGAALAVKGGLAALKKSAGTPSVVLFSSVAARQGFTFHSSMGMAKGAVSGLTLSLAAELAPKIRINAVAPSLTKTPLAESILANEQVASAIAELHPLKRLGTSADIGNLVAYLLSDQAGWLTGQIISIDGGRSTLRPNG